MIRDIIECSRRAGHTILPQLMPHISLPASQQQQQQQPEQSVHELRPAIPTAIASCSSPSISANASTTDAHLQRERQRIQHRQYLEQLHRHLKTHTLAESTSYFEITRYFPSTLLDDNLSGSTAGRLSGNAEFCAWSKESRMPSQLALLTMARRVAQASSEYYGRPCLSLMFAYLVQLSAASDTEGLSIATSRYRSHVTDLLLGRYH
jgi:hypothetical protein